jgi:hypothetical protein
LVEGGEGLGNARDGYFVGGYVEIGYCMPDELEKCQSKVFGSTS